MTYIRKIIQCGKICLIREYPAPAFGKNRHKPQPRNLTSKQQMKLNDRYAAQNLAMEILANFIPGTDMFVTLTHPPWINEENAKKAIQKFLRIMRKHYKKASKEFRYILVTEKQGCWHHHMILEDIPLKIIRKYWNKATENMRNEKEENRITFSTLDSYDNFKSLSEYLVNPEKPSRKEDPSPAEEENAKAQRQKGARRYSCSKNLEKPVITPQTLKRISKTEPRPPKGYKLQAWNKWCDTWGDMHAEYTCVWTGTGKPPKARRRGISAPHPRN